MNRNPGAPSPRLQALGRRYVAWGSVKSGLRVEVEPAPLLPEAAAAIRRHVRQTADRVIAPHDPQAAAVVVAILIGDRAGLDEEVERRLQRAGTYHVIAISGGNVALVAALCFGLIRIVARSRRVVSGATCAVIVAYGRVVGDDPSVERAVTAACLVLGVHAFGLKPKAAHLVSAAALVLVMGDPLIVVDVGAWLSFGATLGIVVLAGRLARAMGGSPTAGAAYRTRVLRRWVAMPLLLLFSATVAAELFILPVQANVFSRVGVAGLALNFVAIPAMAAVQVSGFGAVILADVWPAAGALAAHAARQAAGLLISSASLVDVAPWVSWRAPPSGLAMSAGYYALLTGTIWLSPSRRRTLCAGLTALTAGVLATGPAVGCAAPGPGVVRLTVLDVGQGEALVVQLPGRRTMVVDTGGSTGTFDVGGRVVVPALWALGVRRLDWLVVTHPDVDHVGAGPAVIADLAPREIWEGVPVMGHAPREAMLRAAQTAGVAIRVVQRGDVLDVGGVRIEVVHPPAPDWERRAVRNDDSVVLRLQTGLVEMILAGDAGPEFEASEQPVAAGVLRVLKVAHHGSRSSTTSQFLGRFRPDVALVSAGAGNVFGHPHSDVLSRLAGVGAATFRTDRDGAITIESDGRGVEVRTASGRAWQLASYGAPGPS